MQSFELTSLQEQLKQREKIVQQLDDKLAQELTRQAVLQELLGASSNEGSERSKSQLSESSISLSQASNTSVSSEFLKKEIANVYSFMQGRSKVQNVSQLPNPNNLSYTRQKNKLEQKDHHHKQALKEADYSSFFNKTTKNFDATIKLENLDRIKRQKQRQQELKRQEIVEFLEAKQQLRHQKLQKQRMKVRQELIKQENLNKQNMLLAAPEKQKLKDISILYPDSNILKNQRNIAFKRLLKQTQKEIRKTNKIIQRTRIASFQ